LISAIILTLNSMGFIESCLDSVFKQDSTEVEIIIVDNASKDNTIDFIKENYPKINLIVNKENLGAAKARNQGIERARGEWILTLDCDIILEKDFISKILNITKNLSPKVGMIQPKILKSNRKTIFSTGISLSFLKRFYDIGKDIKDLGQFNKPKYVFGVCSASAPYSRKMLEEIKESTGYFDERFFFLVEDVDLAWRAQRKGWKALYYPEAISYHDGNSSSLNKSLRQFLCWRNRKFMLKKYRLNRFKLTIVYLFYDLPRAVFLFLFNSHVRNAILNKNNFNINEVKY